MTNTRRSFLHALGASAMLATVAAARIAIAAEPALPALPRLPPERYEHPDWFKDSFLHLAEDVAEAAKAGRYLILYFYQDGCPYCAKFLRENFTQAKVVAKTRKHFDIVALNTFGSREVVDIDGQTLAEKDYANKLRIGGTPSLIFFDANAGVALRQIGYPSPRRFDLAMNYVSTGQTKRQSFQDYLTANGYSGR